MNSAIKVYMLITEPKIRNEKVFLNISSKSMGLARSASTSIFESLDISTLKSDLTDNPRIVF